MGIEQIRMNQTKALPPAFQFNWNRVHHRTIPCLHGSLLSTTIRSLVNLSVKSSARETRRQEKKSMSWCSRESSTLEVSLCGRCGPIQERGQAVGPHGFTNPVSELDVRLGDAIRIHMCGPDSTV
jgi:hypothetical protein